MAGAAGQRLQQLYLLMQDLGLVNFRTKELREVLGDDCSGGSQSEGKCDWLDAAENIVVKVRQFTY
jgi:hypothetical protein